MGYNDTIQYGGEELYITDINPVKVPITIKQKIGMAVVELPIIGRTLQDYQLQVTGLIIADSLTQLGTNRAALEALDDGEPHALVDGIHDGNYVIQTGSLRFRDNADNTGNTHYVYTFTLLQKQ